MIEKLPDVRAFCHPTGTNKVINLSCMNTHTLSHTVKLRAAVVVMYVCALLCSRREDGGGPDHMYVCAGTG